MAKILRFKGNPHHRFWDNGKVALNVGGYARIPEEVTEEEAAQKVADGPAGTFAIEETEEAPKPTAGEATRSVDAPPADRMRRGPGAKRGEG